MFTFKRKKRLLRKCVNIVRRTPYFIEVLVDASPENSGLGLHFAEICWRLVDTFRKYVDVWLTLLANMLALLVPCKHPNSDMP
jgi:hypothetical protein